MVFVELYVKLNRNSDLSFDLFHLVRTIQHIRRPYTLLVYKKQVACSIYSTIIQPPVSVYKVCESIYSTFKHEYVLYCILGVFKTNIFRISKHTRFKKKIVLEFAPSFFNQSYRILKRLV